MTERAPEPPRDDVPDKPKKAPRPVPWGVLKILGAIVGALAAVALVVFLIVNYFGGARVDGATNQPSPVVTQSIRPNTVTEIQQWFGPMRSVDGAKAAGTRLVLINRSGQIDLSSWTVAVDDSWNAVTQPADLAIERQGEKGVTLQDQRTMAVFDLKLGQAFVLDSKPNAVFAVLADDQPADGTNYRLVSVTPEWVKAHGHSYKGGSK